MKKEIQCLFDKIYVIENFLHEDTCKAIVGIFNNYLSDTPHNEFIKGGPAGYSVDVFSPVGEYIKNTPDYSSYNVGLDLLNSVGISMAEAVSQIYGKKFTMMTLFYSAMMPGAENKLHYDNHYLSEDNVIKAKAHNHDDRAALLYLNEEYDGGILNFPNQNWSTKPKPGTLIIFEGDHTIPHEVTKVTSGIRNNLIAFLFPDSYKDRPKNRPIYEMEKELTYEDISNPDIINKPVDISQIL